MRNKILNSIDGDTFSINIKNDKELIGKKIILIRYIDYNYEEEQKKYSTDIPLTFYVKIIDKDERISLTTIDKYPFIITSLVEWGYRYFPLINGLSYDEVVEMRKNVEFFPDDYNYLHSYSLHLLYDKTSKFSNFEYIGNYLIYIPKDIYRPFSLYSCHETCFEENLEERLLNDYRNNNLRRHPFYNSTKSLIDKEDIWGKLTNFMSVNKNNNNNNNFVEKDKKFIIFDNEVSRNIEKIYSKIYFSDLTDEQKMSLICKIIFQKWDSNIGWITLAYKHFEDGKMNNYLRGKAFEALEEEMSICTDEKRRLEFNIVVERLSSIKSTFVYIPNEITKVE